MFDKQISCLDRLGAYSAVRHNRRANACESYSRNRKLRMEPLEDRSLLTSVGVAVVDSLASEGIDGNYGAWEVTRSGESTAACYVNFRLSGTAAGSADYALYASNGSYISLYSSVDPLTNAPCLSGELL